LSRKIEILSSFIGFLVFALADGLLLQLKPNEKVEPSTLSAVLGNDKLEIKWPRIIGLI
jgi:hypothetical protein